MFFSAALVLAVAATASALVIPRATPPTGWDAALLENYDTYHTRYLALDCEDKHNTTFFDQCCHPLLATQSLSSRPQQCIPSATAAPSSGSANDDDCDDDGSNSSLANSRTQQISASVVPTNIPAAPTTTPTDPATTHAAPTTTPTVPSTTKTVEPTTEPKPSPTTTEAHTTSTTSSQAAPKPTSGVLSTFLGGFATFFFQHNTAGACGKVHKDTDLIAAIDIARYGNTGAVSDLCGKSVKVTNTDNNKSVVVTIADACPTCTNSNSIDLSQSAFEAIANLATGMVPISWSFLD